LRVGTTQYAAQLRASIACGRPTHRVSSASVVASAPSIRIVKNFNYRGTVRSFSNRYHFSGGTPADSAHWTTLSDAIVTVEKTLYQSLSTTGAEIVEAIGYAGGSEVPVFTKTYTTQGTGSFAGLLAVIPGDCAAMIRYSTADRSTKNHPIYVFNYYHAVYGQGGSSGADLVNAAQLAAYQAYAADWVAGFSDGANTYKRARPNGDAVTGSFVSPLVTHRDLPH